MSGIAPVPERPLARPDVALRRVGSEWVLFDPGRDRAHVLNLTAAVIWTYLDGQHGPDAIADEIAGRVPAAGEGTVRRDIDDAIRRFSDEGLLR